MLIDGLVVEGQVSAETIRRFLSEPPAGVEGIAMKGMPTGVPGTPGPKEGPIEIFAFGDAADRFRRRMNAGSNLGSPINSERPKQPAEQQHRQNSDQSPCHHGLATSRRR